jgi:hypothetical protein
MQELARSIAERRAVGIQKLGTPSGKAQELGMGIFIV